MRLPLRSVPLCRDDRRLTEKLGSQNVRAVRRHAAVRSDRELPRYRMGTTPPRCDRPGQLLKIWQAHGEPAIESVFVRRPAYRVHRPPLFFSYALLFFTLFNIMNVAFALSAIGANLVWPVALYSSQALLRGKGSAAGISTASAEASTGMRG